MSPKGHFSLGTYRYGVGKTFARQTSKITGESYRFRQRMQREGQEGSHD